MSRIRKAQQGSILDEEDLFDDPTIPGAGEDDNPPPAGGNLEGELVDDVDDINPPAPVDPNLEEEEEEEEGEGEDVALTGVEQFLTNYGVNGGLITYEDGSTARFSELDDEEQSNILSSLISESVPTIEEKFNLDEDEINLLNAVRESELSSEEFINDLLNSRLQTVLASRDSNNTDYENLSTEAIFVKSLKDNDPDITEEAIAQELVKAKELSSFNSTVEAIRKTYISDQQAYNNKTQAEKDALFNQELEAQRYEIVQSVEDIADIAGASITPQMKEYLLQDIMELNEEKDPILMEKIFSDPQTMFEANWFLNYGKDYINQLSNYWKNQVSIAEKRGYSKAAGRMSNNPTIIGEDGKPKKQQNTSTSGSSANTFGQVVSEEELFDE